MGDVEDVLILGLLTLIIIEVALGILTIIWLLNLIAKFFSVEIPWYVYGFVILLFVLSSIRITIKKYGG